MVCYRTFVRCTVAVLSSVCLLTVIVVDITQYKAFANTVSVCVYVEYRYSTFANTKCAVHCMAYIYANRVYKTKSGQSKLSACRIFHCLNCNVSTDMIMESSAPQWNGRTFRVWIHIFGNEINSVCTAHTHDSLVYISCDVCMRNMSRLQFRK